MSARLYGGFGSGKGTYEGFLKVNSVGSIGRDDLEYGDKILLPTSTFKEISRLKLPLPLIFQAHNDKAKQAATIPSKTGKMPAQLAQQFCGVMEFSAPDGQAYLPSWMMGNLKLREGGQARFTTTAWGAEIRPGAFLRLRPHTTAFTELAAAIGPRELLEMALRNYTALAPGERIALEVAGDRFLLDVTEVKGVEPPAPPVSKVRAALGPGAPASKPPPPCIAISLLGNLDLEVEFDPPKDAVGEEAAVAPAAAPVAAPAPAPAPAPAASPAKAAPKASPTRAAAGSSPAVKAASPAAAVATPTRHTAQPRAAAEPHTPPPAAAASRPAAAAAPALLASPPLMLPTGVHAFHEHEGMSFPEMKDVVWRRGYDLSSYHGGGGTESASAAAGAAGAASTAATAHDVRAARLRALEAAAAGAASSGQSAAPPPAAAPQASPPRAAASAAAPAGPDPSLPPSAFAEPTGSEGMVRCTLCMTVVGEANFDLHIARCRRNTDFHKKPCPVCCVPVYLKDTARHIHCEGCSELLDVPADAAGLAPDALASLAKRLHLPTCKANVTTCECKAFTGTTAEIAAHKASRQCAAVPAVCTYCKVAQKREALEAHEARCGTRTGQCEHCNKWVMLKAMAEHVATTCPALFPPPSPPTPPPAAEGASAAASPERLDAGDGGVLAAVDAAFKATVKASAAATGSGLRAPGASARTSSIPGPRAAASSAAAAAPAGSGGSAVRGLRKATATTTAAATSEPAAAAAGAAALGAAIGIRGTAAAGAKAGTRPAAAAAAARPGSGAAPKAAPSRAGAEVFPCPHCKARCSDYEALQMHVFTACTKAAAAEGGEGATPAAPPAAAAPASRLQAPTASRIAKPSSLPGASLRR